MGLDLTLAGTTRLIYPVVTSTLLPTDIPDIKFWCNGKRSVITEVANAVSDYSDLTGNGFPLVQATGSRQPIFDPADFGITFDGSNDHMTNAAASMYNSASGGTLIIRFELLTLSNTDTVATEYGSGTSSYYSVARMRSNADPTPQSADDAGTGVINDSGLETVTDISTLGIFNYVQQVDATLFNCFIDNVAGNSPRALDRTGHTLTLDTFSLGSRRGSDRFNHMKVYDIAMYDRKLSVGELTQYNTYLNTEWA